MPATAPWIALCAAATAALLVSERRGWRAGIWICKPLASTAFVALALAAGGLDSDYGRLVVAGLGLCWLGDLLLIPAGSETAFLAGIASFLLGHVAYALAFVGLGLDLAGLAVTGAVVALLGAGVLRWLRPHLHGIFAAAVPLYVVVIGSMVATAVSAVVAGGPLAAAVGGVAFAVSDVSVARDRLVAPGFANAAWGLPLYFGAQLLIAGSVATLA